MNNFFDDIPIRIPVKLVDDKWEYFYGGELPIKNGTIGELVVEKHSIEEKDFLAQLKRKSKHQILKVGTPLLVALTIKRLADIPENIQCHLLPVGKDGPELGDIYYHTLRSAGTRFIRITISGPTARQIREDLKAEGGVWIELEGLHPKSLSTSMVELPDGVSKDHVDSLNHAFTLLSEKFEPWRKSHTGNIYDRMLYQEMNGKWYPLNILRNAAVAQEEHQLIRDQWAQICKLLNFQMDQGHCNNE